MLMHVHLVLASRATARHNAIAHVCTLTPVESGESEVSEAAVTEAPASFAGETGPAANWSWLSAAAEMAAEVSGVWPLTRHPAAQPWPGYPKVATRTPGAGADSVRVARDFTATTLRRWGVGERGDDIVIVVSELLTNALRYTVPCPGAVWPRWPVRLGLLQPGPWVLCAISDPSDQVPVPKEPGWFGESGRGLQVVASLCDEWGCTPPGPMGKVVWAMFGTGPAR
jgi:histidine kinase-like protein